MTSRQQTQAKLDQIIAGAAAHTPAQRYTVADRLEQQVKENGAAPFIIFDDQVYSYARINSDANRIAHLLAARGLACADVVALMMENRPQFISTWLGLAKLGVTAALLNPNTRDTALLHAVQTTRCKLVLAGAECQHQLQPVAAALESLPILVIGEDAAGTAAARPFLDITADLAACRQDNPAPSARTALRAEEPLFYIFTSGTTGLPKAARLSHMRWLGVGDSWHRLMTLDASDVFYCVLPLYHGAAGMSLTSPALAAGASIVLKRRFSASQFWADVRRYRVTHCQYIGEICRYLMNQPARADDADNPLRRMVGAGLGADIWQAFQTRFAVDHIYEGWGATEANCGMTNVDNKVGSCGRIPFKEKSNIRLVRYDVEHGCHLTDDDGHLQECAADEVGELIAMIIDSPDSGGGRYEGYTDAAASEQKVLRNVFTAGDAWFRSGDLLRHDADDYYYFVDRIGDTFRWKSENVSTQEVAEALSAYDGLDSINIYGVKVPDSEGRAGMASLVLASGHDFDPRAFCDWNSRHLPKYARPLFVRISKQAEMTATFKLRKVDLQKEGYDLQTIDDPLYVLDDGAGTYVDITDDSLRALGIAPFRRQ